MPELIDKQAALKKMCESCGYCEKFEKAMRTTHPDFVSDKCGYYKFLAEQPTIDAEPVRHGRLAKAADKQYCTECRAVTKVRNAPFCWHCGAKIDLRTPTEVALDIADSVMMGGADNDT